MCYRASTNFSHVDVLKDKSFGVTKVETEFLPRYNVSITQYIPVIVPGSRILSLYKWGLIPRWSKDEKIGVFLGNARAETITEKPSFRESFMDRRCLVLVSGFFEWDKEKNPYYVKVKDKKIFALAGLYDSWNNPEGKGIKTCTVITTEPNKKIGSVHERMPVILNPLNYSTWLIGKNIIEVHKLLATYDDSDIEMYKVSRMANSVKNDIPLVIEPIDEPDSRQKKLV
jgi:putative SOS response-associated peptidase YedK